MTTSRVLVLGGARSGKSAYAEKIAAQLGQRVLYVATAEVLDDEMAERVAAHRQTRPAGWQTLEAPRQVGAALTAVTEPPEVLLLDCMTLLVSNIVLARETESSSAVQAAVQAEIEAIIAAQKQLDVPLVVVSSEVGLGLIPAYRMGRVYRDALGWANQKLAAVADQVFLVVAGLPIALKGGP